MPASSNRAIVVVGIVVIIALALGLFFYSERAQAPAPEDKLGAEVVPAPVVTTATTTAATTTETMPKENASAVPNPLPAQKTAPKTTTAKPVAIPTYGAVVTLTNTGFQPSRVTIYKGQTIRFVNKSTDYDMWVASGIHPTHASYQEKSTHDCFGSTFDACAGAKTGAYWDFTFNLLGSWDFHNHMHPTDDGVVYVKERE